jgi:osmotically inducible protein OsmC
MPISKADATWTGNLRDGEGTMAADSGEFDGAEFSFATRFGDQAGTNPEELIAAAHAGCFSMALSNELDEAGFTPEEVSTHAEVHLEDGAIVRIHLTTHATVPDIDGEEFMSIAQEAKENCPVSVALGAVEEISLDATLN